MANRRLTLRLVTLAALALLAVPAFAANLVIVNVNAPGVGFNDPTPAAPVGGNPGTTIGQQRLNAFQFAANIWGATLSSPETIYIQSSFVPLACSATAGTLGAAGAIQIFANFAGAEVPNVWYNVAISNKLSGGDLAPGATGTNADDIVAFFNSNLGTATCLTSTGGFYYGYDNNHGLQVDLIAVLLHEFGHGLGFQNFVTEATGTNSGPPFLSDIYSVYTKDDTTGKTWDQMNDAERQASAINSRKVSWTGINVTASVPTTLASGTPLLRVNTPAAIAGNYDVGLAAFGPAITLAGVTGNVVQALDPADATGPSTTDGCSPITNAAAVAGNIAIVDRGTCGFTIKVKNAQNAGAAAVLVADNAIGSPPAGLGGADATITIPSVRITQADGNTIKAQLGSGVNASLTLDPAVRAGANTAGRMLLNAPNPVVPGSSISHWDPIATPNLLMEPSINSDLTHGLDLTLPEMVDIGWFSDRDGVPDGRDACIGSDQSATVVIDGCDSHVNNTVFSSGCRISDSIEDCAAGAANHDAFLICVANYTNLLKKNGTITNREKGAIQACAGQSSLP